VGARLWPGIEPLRHLVTLQVEPQGCVEIEELKVDAAQEVGNPGDIEGIARLGCIVAEGVQLSV
jgi:hypothetical protein